MELLHRVFLQLYLLNPDTNKSHQEAVLAGAKLLTQGACFVHDVCFLYGRVNDGHADTQDEEILSLTWRLGNVQILNRKE